MLIRYVGRHRGGVHVGPADTLVAHGDTVEVPDDVGASLLEQGGEFAPADETPPPKPKKKTAPPVDDGDEEGES